MAISAAVPIYTQSAPSAIAFITSALLRILPDAMIEMLSRIPSSLRRLSTLASASSMGIPTLSLIRVGAAPVPPLKPSIAMMSAPLLAMPLAMAEMLCTAAILTMTGFL